MRLCTAILAAAPFCSWAFAPSPSTFGAVTSTSLEARRLLSPTLRRPRPSFFTDFDRMFDEVEEMMEKSFGSHPLGLVDDETGLTLKRPLGFDITQDEHEYKVSMNVPDVAAKNLDLQLDHDGRVLRLRGERMHEDSGFKVRSRFEKAILLSPDIDPSKLQANFDQTEGMLTVVAPKFDPHEVLEKEAKKLDTKKIDIQLEEPKAALESSTDTDASASTVTTKIPLESPTAEKIENKESTLWPGKDYLIE
jgi:HSP20 family molecular chaperone IbpA